MTLLLALLPGCPLPSVLPDSADSGPYVDVRPANPTCVAAARPISTTDLVLEPAFSGRTFSYPVGLYAPPTPDGWWTVIRQRGEIYRFQDDGTTDVEEIVALGDVVYPGGSEEGLLGLAYAPDFATSGEVYLNYTALEGTQLQSRVSRILSFDGGLSFDLDSLEVLLTVDQPYSNHNGGNLAFGPDGYLYVGFGDGGSAGDPSGNGQNADVLLGKMLRLDVSGGGPYTIPADNPFASEGGAPEVYAWGLRNPWRYFFDPESGELWAGDVGQGTYEEFDLIERGGNYGWNHMEGMHCYKPQNGCVTAGMILPVSEYPQVDGESASIVGGPVYRGSRIPGLVGAPLYADVYTGTISAVTTDAESGAWVTEQVLPNTGIQIVSWGQDEAGEVYAVEYAADGQMWSLAPGGEPAVDPFPARLSETGCFEAGNVAQPVPAMLAYDVNMALWSDEAEKERWFAIPDGTTVTVTDDGRLDLPVGSVVAKHFRLGEQLVETRLLMRHDDGDWAGYSYRWNEAGTDAELLPWSAATEWEAGTWHYPSRAQCLQCHASVSGRTLGLTTAQLDREATFPWGETVNVLSRLARIGVLDLATDPEADPDVVTAMPTLEGDAPLDERARAYLAVNCAHCHQPGGSGLGAVDLRVETPLASTGLCGLTPQNGDLDVAGALLLDPGRPENSVLSLRMHSTGAYRMPGIGSEVVDTEGTAVVDAWIASLLGCE
ncbi:hypothetical protein LBMAG42_07980 [Deltaproteobacteria bacterium]|nr:hypothetical protein LBMAG42_07980 [Deltaproteobacteria bacterium]